MKLRGVALAAAGLALTACQSQWYLQHESSDKLVTDVVIRTDPADAEILWQNVSLGRAPLRMPVEYDHVEELWTRQTNVGAELRESWGTLGSIIGFPVWAVASLFHESEDRRRHVYGHNVFQAVARRPGYADAEREVRLEGEDEVEVRITLTPR